jgi:hypothetical protein
MNEDTMRMLAKLCPVWAGVFMFLLVAAPMHAGDVKVVGHYENGGVTAEIDTYSENGAVVAVVAFTSGGRTMTFAFDRNDWPALENLWKSARQVHGAKFVSQGSVSEAGTEEKSVIAAAGGPAIRLTILSPIDGAVVFNVPPKMAADFEAKLKLAASATTKS